MIALVAIVVSALATTSFASVSLVVDAAPNVYGSPDWGPWWSAAEAAVAGGTFVNMGSTPYAGTTTFDPYDEMVYSAGDLGKRLTFIYWIPDQTVASLTGNFQIKLAIDWDGTRYALNWDTDGWDNDGLNVDWVAPGNWTNYNGGVIGSIGLGWWPVGSDGIPADVTQADIDSYASMLYANQTSAVGEVRIWDPTTGSWQETDLQANMVPEPATMIVWSLLGSASWLGMRVVRRGRRVGRQPWSNENRAAILDIIGKR
jgi:hypothetical protein